MNLLAVVGDMCQDQKPSKQKKVLKKLEEINIERMQQKQIKNKNQRVGRQKKKVKF